MNIHFILKLKFIIFPNIKTILLWIIWEKIKKPKIKLIERIIIIIIMFLDIVIIQRRKYLIN